MPKEFGLKKINTSSLKKLNIVSGAFVFCAAIIFSLSVLYGRLNMFVSADNKIDLFKENLQQVAVYFLPIDKQFSKFLVDLDNLIRAYVAGENILVSQDSKINDLWTYVQKNKNYLKKLGFTQYEEIINLVSDLRKYKETVYDLLGKDQSYNYLVILQNTNEKRPNGGFFGSFALVTMGKGHIKNLEIIDSYYPDFVAQNTRILAPEWSWSFLSDHKIGYIAGNKFGFTDIDAQNLKDLYEKIFNQTYDMDKVKQTMHPDLYAKVLHQNIKGVVFVRSDMLEKLLPDFNKKIWEWQFLNASVDILRGEIRGNKKEYYIKEVKDYFEKNRFVLFKNLVNNFTQITDNQGVSVWISGAQTGLNSILTKYRLSNVYSSGYIYAWDTNVSFDKVDGFVSKEVEITNEHGDVMIEQVGDIYNISQFPSGKYTLKITYSLDVNDNYVDFIKALEKKYAITLTDREKGILALQSTMYTDPKWGNVWKWWESKSTIYFPQNTEINVVEGDIFYKEQFTPPFAKGLFYQIGINKNHTSKTIIVKFTKK